LIAGPLNPLLPFRRERNKLSREGLFSVLPLNRCTAVPFHLSLFPVKLFTFAKTCLMINNEQIKDLSERRDALRRYL